MCSNYLDLLTYFKLSDCCCFFLFVYLATHDKMSLSWLEDSFACTPTKCQPSTSNSSNQRPTTTPILPVNNKLSTPVNGTSRATHVRKRALSDDLEPSRSGSSTNKVITLKDIEPKSSSELAVSKQKLNELKTWFSEHFSSNSHLSNSPFLLLNGPAGSGKTISVKLLSKEFKVKLVELNTSSIFTDAVTEGLNNMSLEARRFNDDLDNVKSLYAESQQSRFRRLLKDLNSYKNNLFWQEGNTPSTLLLIEDMPQIFNMKPELLREELEKLLRKPNPVPIVFIMSDTVNCQSVESKVLPKSVLHKLNFQTISFKPISNTCLTKALNASPFSKNLKKSDIDEIVAASSNDIRNAFNYLIFRYTNQQKQHQFLSKHSFTKRAKLSKGNEVKKPGDNHSTEYFQSGREEQLNLVHAVGKVLYAKREKAVDPITVDFDKKHSIERSLLRNILIEKQPEDIAERANASCDTLADWVYENYYDFISENAPLNQTVDCLEVLSDINSIFRDFESKNAIESLRTSYLLRGEMFVLNPDASSYPNSTSDLYKRSNSFRPLRGPQFKQLNQNSNENTEKLMMIKDSTLYDYSIVELDKNLLLDILPCVNFIDDLRDRATKMKLDSYIRDLTEFGSSSQSRPYRTYAKATFNSNRMASQEEEESADSIQQFNSVNRKPATSSLILSNHEPDLFDIDCLTIDDDSD